LGTLALNGDPYIFSPGGLTYTAGNFSVTLDSYGFGEPGVFGGAPLDRVGNLDSQPDTYADSVGTFTITVASVPEPSVNSMILVGLVCFLGTKRMLLSRKGT
jgi:hypothetical protein